MVCRENKGRSAVMGLHKALLRHQGLTNFDDSDLQSAIHDFGHAHASAGAPPIEQQVTFLEGLRTQVIATPHISEADKFRQAPNQPGLVTRIDQELARMRTGKDEHGRPLRPEQLMRGRDWAAAQRMGVMLNRGQRAQTEYLTVYARHTGVSLSQASAEFDALKRRPATERKNTRISLRDDWRERLAVAGVSAETQADLGQSNKAREAIRIMEERRLAAIESLPQRPTIRPEHVIETVHPDTARKMRCEGEGGCGQFGHERPSCPNQALLSQHATAQEQWAKADAAYRVYAGADQSTLDDEGRGSMDRARRARDRASEQVEKIEASIEANDPPMSKMVSSLGYNPDSGLLVVTTRERTNKATGTVSPSRKYRYRMSNDEHRQMLASGYIDQHLADSVFRRRRDGGADQYHFENAADAEAAGTEARCPTCGQWASLTAGHQCTVGGTRTEAMEAARGVQIAQARRAARDSGTPVPPAVSPKTAYVAGSVTVAAASGGSVSFGGLNQAEKHLSEGKVVRAWSHGLMRGASPEGVVPVWDDPASGRRFIGGQGSELRCQCPNYRKNARCEHTRAVLATMAVHYGAQEYDGPMGGSIDLDDLDEEEARPVGVSKDAPTHDYQRRDYDRIRDLRRAQSEAVSQRQTTDAEWVYAGPTTLGGQPVPTPVSLTMPNPRTGEASSVDLTDARNVQDRLRRDLRARSASGRTPGGKHWSVTRGADGSLLVSTARNRLGKGGIITPNERAELSRLLSIPAARVSARGLYIPAHPAWRGEFVQRAAGANVSLRGPSLVPPGAALGRDTGGR